jgi:3-isopropylmalate/(R)-2-methylmalate dehydratase small subunit
MTLILHGRAWVFGDNLDADWQICTLTRLEELKVRGLPMTAETLGPYCLEAVIPDFAHLVRPGDLIVAGENAGCSTACLDGDPDDPHLIGAATLSLMGAGIAGVLCASAFATFLRNSLNIGFPIVECPELTDRVHTGDELRVDMVTGVVDHPTTGHRSRFRPYPDFILQMLEAGGLYASLQREA